MLVRKEKRDEDLVKRTWFTLLEEIQMNNQFRYLGSINQIGGENRHWCQPYDSNWLVEMEDKGVLCDRNIPLRLKGKFYMNTVRQVLLYGTECCTIKKCHS